MPQLCFGGLCGLAICHFLERCLLSLVRFASCAEEGRLGLWMAILWQTSKRATIVPWAVLPRTMQGNAVRNMLNETRMIIRNTQGHFTVLAYKAGFDLAVVVGCNTRT